MEHYVVLDLAVCIVAAWIFGVVAQALRQPLILAYLAAGVVIGPVGLKLVTARGSIETISSLGLVLLLFLIGLEIDLKKIMSTGRLILVTALVQCAGCVLLGLAFFRVTGFALGERRLDALYLAVAAAFSSTVIIIKLLYEQRQLDTLQGRITIGIMVIQDLATILFLAVQPNLNEPSFGILFASFGKVIVLLSIAFLASRYALPPLFRAVARLPELVLIGAIAWCFLIAGTAGAFQLSREMGALIAGVAISTFPYTLDIAAKLTSLRDFFVTLFFVALGMAVPLPNVEYILWALAISAFVFASRILTVVPCLHALRQGFRSSILPAVNLSQISELSLVIMTIGGNLGHVSPKTQGILAYAFIFAAVASSYAITVSEGLLARITPLLGRLGIRDQGGETVFNTKPSGHPRIYLLGFFWTASSLLEEITRHAPHLLGETLVIDFNPNVNSELRHRRIPVVYGDITQRDTLLHAGIGSAEVIVCSLPNSILRGATNLRLLQQLRELNPSAKIIMHAELFADVPKLYAAGADYVSVPRLIEARELRKVVEAALDGLIQQKREELDAELERRKEVIP